MRPAWRPWHNLVPNSRASFFVHFAGACARRSLTLHPLFAHASARVPQVSFVEVRIPVAPPGPRTPVGHHHRRPHLSVRRMRLARLAPLGVIPRRVPFTAIDRDSSSASTHTIVHSGTPACCNRDGTVA